MSTDYLNTYDSCEVEVVIFDLTSPCWQVHLTFFFFVTAYQVLDSKDG